jgi:hypothetical protein
VVRLNQSRQRLRAIRRIEKKMRNRVGWKAEWYFHSYKNGWEKKNEDLARMEDVPLDGRRKQENPWHLNIGNVMFWM